MNKIMITLLMLFLTITAIQGQDFSKEFGKITQDEFELKKYAGDANAEAVVLYDIGKSYFVDYEGVFKVVFERTTKIKVFSESGIKWSEVEIPLYQEGDIYEKVYEIEAYTYNNENGRISKTALNQANIFDEKINNSWVVRKFAMPDVKAGSIIEFRYKVSSQYLFNLRDWEFQKRIPVIYSEYMVKMVPFYEYSWIVQGIKKFDVSESYKDNGNPRTFGSGAGYGSNTYYDMVYKFGMKNVPAFKDEEFISSINDYIIKLDFQLSKVNYLAGGSKAILTTWPELIKDMAKHQDFGKYVSKSEKLSEKLIDTENLKSKSAKERFDYVMDYIKANYSWDGRQDKYASKSPNKFMNEKLGNCADINLFATGMLKSVGIEAYPVLISTRNHGKMKIDYPFSHFFNYVIVIADVDGTNILTDGTDVMSLNARIPERCINDNGLIIDEKAEKWISLECKFPSEVFTQVNIDLKDPGAIIGSITKSSTEYDAVNFRSAYSGNINNIKEQLKSKSYAVIDSTISVTNRSDFKKPFILSYSLADKPEIVNDKIYLQPFLDEVVNDNPLKQNSRTYPIDMTYPKKRVYKSVIEIPEGYKVDYVPAAQQVKNQLFELNYSVVHDSDRIVVTFDYFFKKAVYPSTDYPVIKVYFNNIVKTGNDKIVLSKMITGSN